MVGIDSRDEKSLGGSKTLVLISVAVLDMSSGEHFWALSSAARNLLRGIKVLRNVDVQWWCLASLWLTVFQS